MRQVHVNNKVGFSTLTVLKPLTPGEVARLAVTERVVGTVVRWLYGYFFEKSNQKTFELGE